MANSINIYETEQGDPVTITGKESDGITDSDLSWVVEGDSTIEVKTKDVIKLTLVGTTDFTLSDPIFSWTPKDVQLNKLTKNINYECFIHARNDATPRERVLTFTLRILNS